MHERKITPVLMRTCYTDVKWVVMLMKDVKMSNFKVKKRFYIFPNYSESTTASIKQKNEKHVTLLDLWITLCHNNQLHGTKTELRFSGSRRDKIRLQFSTDS